MDHEERKKLMTASIRDVDMDENVKNQVEGKENKLTSTGWREKENS